MDKILDLRSNKIIVFTLYISLFTGIALFIAVPGLKDIRRLKTRHQSLENEAKFMKLEAAGFARSEERKLKEELDRLNTILPEEVDYLMLYQKFINRYKNRHKIDFTIFEPVIGKAGNKDIIPIKLSFKSDYAALADYLAYIEDMGFITSTEEASLNISDNDSGLLNISMIINLYVRRSPLDSQYSRKNRQGDHKYTISNPSNITFISMPKGTGKNAEPLDIKIAGIVGNNTIIIGDNTYEIGNKVKGWTISKIDSSMGEVIFTHGRTEEIVRID